MLLGDVVKATYERFSSSSRLFGPESRVKAFAPRRVQNPGKSGRPPQEGSRDGRKGVLCTRRGRSTGAGRC
jgi:hypothetical protein